MPFRFQGQRALLTYSHVGNFFAANDFALAVISHIANLGNADFRWKWAIELHNDDNNYDNDMEEGSWHVHVVFDLGKPCTERGQVFDFGGFHSNIAPCRGKTQWINQLRYLEKEGWFKTNIEDRLDEEIEGENAGDIFRRALEMDTEEVRLFF